MLTWHLLVFFGEASVKVFGPCFNQVVFLVWSLKSSMYILDKSPLSDVSLAFFSQSVA